MSQSDVNGAAEPHFKVAHAAMEAAESALLHHTAMLEGHLERLMPALSQRLTDAKEVLRSAATRCACVYCCVRDRVTDFHPCKHSPACTPACLIVMLCLLPRVAESHTGSWLVQQHKLKATLNSQSHEK